LIERRVIQFGGIVQIKEAGHRIVQPEIGEPAGQDHITRMAQRENEAAFREQAVDRGGVAQMHRVLVQHNAVIRQFGQSARPLEIARTRRLDLIALNPDRAATPPNSASISAMIEASSSTRTRGSAINIVSSSVVPERGKPSRKIGAGGWI
jgi:hypothetical protein